MANRELQIDVNVVLNTWHWKAALIIVLLGAIASMLCLALMLTPQANAAPPAQDEPIIVQVVRPVPPWQPRALDAIVWLSPKIDAEWAIELSDLIGSEFYMLELPDEVEHPVLLGIALCYVESSFNPDATNKTTRCAGLFQLHPMHKIKDVYDPAINVEWGALKLSKYCKDRGSLAGGLSRYGTAKSRVLKLYAKLVDELVEVQND